MCGLSLSPFKGVLWILLLVAALAAPFAYLRRTHAAPYGLSTSVSALEERWGIRIEGVRLSAGGYMLDFRYRVLDPAKASPLTEPSLKPYLLQVRTGMKLMVPAPGKVGPLRSTLRNDRPKAGKVYFVLFANPGKAVAAGDAVAVAVGDFKAEGDSTLIVKG